MGGTAGETSRSPMRDLKDTGLGKARKRRVLANSAFGFSVCCTEEKLC